jgi:hypothetical protein
MREAKIHYYEVLSCWGPQFKADNFGDVLVVSSPPDKDGYCRFTTDDGGFEGRYLCSEEEASLFGGDVDYFLELAKLEIRVGRPRLLAHYARWMGDSLDA